MDPRLITPYLIAALVAWRLYRRARRSFGRQQVRDRLMWMRIGILTVVAVLMGALFGRDVALLGGLLGGIACGALLGYIGLRYTKFEVTADGRFYTPHTYIGIIVTALFVGRVLYRMLGVYSGTVPAAPGGPGLAAYHSSPITLSVLGALVGYYVLYYLGVLQRTKPAASIASPTA